MRKSKNPENYKPIFRYLALNVNSRPTNYSDTFHNYEDAIKWYENFGRKLEIRFNRTLIFRTSKLQINKPLQL